MMVMITVTVMSMFDFVHSESDGPRCKSYPRVHCFVRFSVTCHLEEHKQYSYIRSKG